MGPVRGVRREVGQAAPAISRLWRNAWSEFVPFLDYDVEIRKIICSTNAIWVLYLQGWRGRCFPCRCSGWRALTLNANGTPSRLSWIRSVGLAA